MSDTSYVSETSDLSASSVSDANEAPPVDPAAPGADASKGWEEKRTWEGCSVRYWVNAEDKRQYFKATDLKQDETPDKAWTRICKEREEKITKLDNDLQVCNIELQCLEKGSLAGANLPKARIDELQWCEKSKWSEKSMDDVEVQYTSFGHVIGQSKVHYWMPKDSVESDLATIKTNKKFIYQTYAADDTLDKAYGRWKNNKILESKATINDKTIAKQKLLEEKNNPQPFVVKEEPAWQPRYGYMSRYQ